MKKLIILITVSSVTVTAQSQDFKTDVATAKTSYAANKLEDAHFALQQALSEIDMIIGREVLKLLPAKMDTAVSNSKEDNVSSNVGFAGATVHRSYGKSEKATIEIISNSPLIGTLNTLMNMPMMGGLMRDENNKTVKVQGYKARLEKQSGNDDQPTYELKIPFSSALLTLTVQKTSEKEILKFADTLPLDQIAKLIQ
jgi:hypothetical protein